MKPIGIIENCTGTPVAELTPRRNSPGLPKSRRAGAPVAPEEPELDADELNEAALRQEFQAALLEHAASEGSLTKIVARMIESEIDRDTALEWGLEAAESGAVTEGHVRSTISRLYGAFQPKRAKGAGRKRPADLDSLINYATERFGDKAESMLLAAYRAMKAKAKEAAKAAKSDDDDGE